MPTIIPVASGKGGVGKSFLTANLAIALAELGRKVIVADLDLGAANLHTFLGLENHHAGVGDFVKTKTADLADFVSYGADAVISKTLLDKPTGTLTLFAFDAGQGLSEHTSPYDATVQILDGQAMITIDGRQIQVDAGQLIVMPANVPHALSAEKPFKMLLTMIR